MENLDILNELMNRVVAKESAPAGKLILAYSQAGIGKTSTFSQAPNSVLVECKDYSSDALKESGSIPKDLPVIKCENWGDSLRVLDILAQTKKFKNVILDGITGLSEWSDSETITHECEGDREKFTAFGRGDRLAGFRWQELMQILNNLKTAGIWVFALGHRATITEKNPSGSDYLKSTLSVPKDKLAQLSKYADAILFMDFITTQVSVNKHSGIGKAVGGESRIMYVTPSASYEAKNRLGLTEPIELGNSPSEAFGNFFKAVKAARKK